MTAIYTDPRCLDHFASGHPESPDRVRAALRGLQDPALQAALKWPEVRAAEPAVIATVHDEQVVRRVAELAVSGGGWVDPDTFVGPPSYDSALVAAGATLQAVADVLAGLQSNAFVIVRPPGHHATATRSMGFCLFNNAAVAAEWAVREGGAQRVAVLDIDVHHGNGTQDIFYARPDVLYFSTHQYPFYPGTGRVEDTGVQEGVGSTVNVPLMAGVGDATFSAAVDRVLVPGVRRFRPDLICLSLGFDGHWADPLAQLNYSLSGYLGAVHAISSLADEVCVGRLVVLLEGGYNFEVIEAGCGMVASLLAGLPVPADRLGPRPETAEPGSARAAVERAAALHQL